MKTRYFWNILFEFTLIFLMSYISSLIKLNSLFGALGIHLTFLPAIFIPSFALFTFPSLLSLITFSFFFKKNFLGLPTLLATASFYFLTKKEFKIQQVRFLFSILLLVLYLIFLISPFGRQIYWYGFGWLCAAILVNYNSLATTAFYSTWLAHSVGTLMYIYSGIINLTIDQYFCLLPISWVERSILTLAILSSYGILNFFAKKFKYILRGLTYSTKL
jgi:hypothetical protein